MFPSVYFAGLFVHTSRFNALLANVSCACGLCQIQPTSASPAGQFCLCFWVVWTVLENGFGDVLKHVGVWFLPSSSRVWHFSTGHRQGVMTISGLKLKNPSSFCFAVIPTPPYIGPDWSFRRFARDNSSCRDTHAACIVVAQVELIYAEYPRKIPPLLISWNETQAPHFHGSFGCARRWAAEERTSTHQPLLGQKPAARVSVCNTRATARLELQGVHSYSVLLHVYYSNLPSYLGIVGRSDRSQYFMIVENG